MTARDPAARPAAASVSAQLRALAAGDVGGGTQVLPAAPTTVEPVALAAAPASHGLRQGIVAAVVTLLVGLLVLLALTRGGGSSSTDLTTTTTTVESTTTTTTKPTTTTSPCDRLQAQRNALDEQQRTLDDTLKGKALHDAQRQLDDQKKSLDNALKSC
jgi:hypothetical protein